MNVFDYVSVGVKVLYANINKMYKIPVFVYLILTARCPNRCIYCNFDMVAKKTQEKNELSAKDIFALIDDIAKAGAKRLQLTGGEPLVRKDLGDIVDYAKRRGLFVGLSLSGFMVEERVKELNNADIVFLSFDGKEDVHDYLRGSGSYKKLLSAMNALEKSKIKYWTTTVINKKNIDCLDFILKMSEERGFFSNFVFLYNEDNEVYNIPTAKSLRGLLLTNDENKKVIKYLIRKKREGSSIGSSESYLKYLLTWDDFRISCSKYKHSDLECYAGRLSCQITSEGLLYGCGPAIGIMEGFDVRELGFREAFNRAQRLGSCNSCIHGCWLESNLLFSLKLKSIINWTKKLKD